VLKRLKKIRLRHEAIPGVYVIAELERGFVKLRLYTRWDYRYDIHCAAQILGRWFLLDVEVVNMREDYLAGFARAPFFDFEADLVYGKMYRFYTGEEVEIDDPREILGAEDHSPVIDYARYRHSKGVKLSTLLKRLRREVKRGETRKALRTLAEIVATTWEIVDDYAAWIASRTGLALGEIASLLKHAAKLYPGLRPFTR